MWPGGLAGGVVGMSLIDLCASCVVGVLFVSVCLFACLSVRLFVWPFLCSNNNNPRILVSDMGNHRVQIFNVEGNVLSTFGSEGKAHGQLRRPYHLAVMRSGERSIPTWFDCVCSACRCLCIADVL